jgi:hypothetical protein
LQGNFYAASRKLSSFAATEAGNVLSTLIAVPLLNPGSILKFVSKALTSFDTDAGYASCCKVVSIFLDSGDVQRVLVICIMLFPRFYQILGGITIFYTIIL